MERISVLVVDDHAVFADALRERLSGEEELGPIAVAYSAAQARERIAGDAFDVAVLDLMLDGASGLDVAGDIAGASPGTRVVMLSASEPIGAVVNALTRGAQAWLPKTVDTGHLVRVIRGVHAGEAWLSPALLGRVLPRLCRDGGAAADPLRTLTSREREVLQCLVDGLNRHDTARRLHLSVNTVRTHTQNLITKLGVHSTLESVAVALRHGVRTSAGQAATPCG